MTLVPEPPQPIDVLRYYERCLEGVEALKRSIGPLIEAGTAVPASRFFGMTSDEFTESLLDLRRELDHQVVLMLTASFEAIFQIDLQERVKRRKKDPLSKELRSWWKDARRRRTEWIDLTSLLKVWKKSAGHSQVIGRMKSLVLFRHWLAHGRYWVDRSGLGDVDPLLAWQIGKAVFDVLPGFRPLPSS